MVGLSAFWRDRDAVEVYKVDAFTGRAFWGNPAGVVPDARGLGDDAMQAIAREMNLSQTAFVLPASPGSGADWRVRFFTPRLEVALCGHATIATFYLLAALGRVRLGRGGAAVRQETGAGVLEVEVRGRGRSPEAVMMTQAPPEDLGPLERPDLEELFALVGADPGAVEAAGLEPGVVSTGLADLLLPLGGLEALEALRPNHEALAQFCRHRGIVSVHAFVPLDPGPPLVARCRDFSPAAGVPEESATGTASGALGAYLAWQGRLRPPSAPGKAPARLVCEQGVNLGRPSRLEVEVDFDGGGPSRVRVGGRAVVAMRGRMRRPEG